MAFTIILFLSIFQIVSFSYAIQTDQQTFVVLATFPFVLVSLFRKWKQKDLVTQLKMDAKGIGFVALFILLIAYTVNGVFRSPFVYHAYRELAIFGGAMLSFVTMIMLVPLLDLRNRSLVKFFKLFVLMMVGASMYAFVEYMGFIETTSSWRFPLEVTGHIGHKNTFGFLAVIALAFIIPEMEENRTKWTYLKLSILYFGLLIADSRLSLALGTVTIIFGALRVFWSSSKAMLFKIVGVLILLSIASSFLWGAGAKGRLTHALKIGEDSFRVSMYEAQWAMFKDSPVVGQGAGSLRDRIILHYPDWFKKKWDASTSAFYGHNEYLQKLSETGMIGFLLYFFFWFGALAIGLRKYRKERDVYDGAMLLVLLWLSVGATFSVASLMAPIPYIIWGVIGYFWGPLFWRKESFPYEVQPLYRVLQFAIMLVAVLSFFEFSRVLLSDMNYVKAGIHTHEKSTVAKFKYLEKAHKILPQNPFLPQHFYVEFLALKKYQEILVYLKEVEKFAPHEISVDYMAATVYAQMHQFDSARVYVERELSRHRQMPQAVRLLIELADVTSDTALLDSLERAFPPKGKMDSPKSFVATSMAAEETYRKAIGPFRYHVGGPWLRIAYEARLEGKVQQTFGQRDELAELLAAIQKRRGRVEQ